MSTVRTYPPDLFAPPEPERTRAASILDDMAERRRDWLRRMRAVLVSLYFHRVAKWGEGHPIAYVTADDAQRLAKERRDLALPAGASPNLFGSVFRAPGWVRSAHKDHQSSTNGSHGNDLYRWRYVGRSS